jgi:hypothetical protein
VALLASMPLFPDYEHKNTKKKRLSFREVPLLFFAHEFVNGYVDKLVSEKNLKANLRLDGQFGGSGREGLSLLAKA